MSKLIFVTGASGFLGSHIVTQLLSAGYSVRAAARGAKVSELKTAYSTFGDRFQAVEVPDIATSQFPDALKDVNAIIHAAAPIPSRASMDAILKGAIDGTLNVVRQAEKAGITRIVYTSSIASALDLMNPKGPITDKDWNPITKDEIAKSGSEMVAYVGAKTHAELALWEFADSHPHLDVTTLNPPFLYGPFADTFKIPKQDYTALSTNGFILRAFLSQGDTYMSSAPYIDVRDAAKAHVLALTSPSSTEAGIGRKRIIIGSIHDFDYAKALEILAKERPELKDHLNKTTPPVLDVKRLLFDVERVEQVLGFKREDYTSFADTLLSAVDGVVALQKEWATNELKA